MATRKMIYLSSGFGMLDEWTDELYCTKLKDGSFSLQEVRVASDSIDKLPSIKGIRTLKGFIDALKKIERVHFDAFNDSKIFDEFYNNLLELDDIFFDGFKDLFYKEEKDPKQKEFEICIENGDFSGAVDKLRFSSSGPISLQEKCKIDNRKAIIACLKTNYMLEDPKELITLNDVVSYIKSAKRVIAGVIDLSQFDENEQQILFAVVNSINKDYKNKA